MQSFQQLALIGPTASGKTALSIKLAKKMHANILSLDSLAIYKDIDIVSAKPAVEEREGIPHYGIDTIAPYENFDVHTYINLYHQVYQESLKENKNLIIVGGTGFYLKMLLDGISHLPEISSNTRKVSYAYLSNLHEAYTFLYDLDPIYMSHISSNDTYRIEKALHIYFETSLIPTEYFKQHPPVPIIDQMQLPIYHIHWERELLRKRIALRTEIMLKQGLIDEICMLEKRYGRKPNCMKSIGIKETLSYLDGHYNKKILSEKITTNTSRLAKRQTTFNNSQFKNITNGSLKELEVLLLKNQ